MSNKTDLQNNNAILGDTPNGLIGGVSSIESALNDIGVEVDKAGTYATFAELKTAIEGIKVLETDQVDALLLDSHKQILLGADGVLEGSVYNFTVDNADAYLAYRTNLTKFLVDLHLPLVGGLDLTKQIAITFGDTVYYVYNILGGSKKATIADLKQVDKYSNETGYRFIVELTFFENSEITGFAIIPTVSMGDVLSLTSDQMDEYMAEGGLTDGQLAICSKVVVNGYTEGGLYRFDITYPDTYTWTELGEKSKLKELTFSSSGSVLTSTEKFDKHIQIMVEFETDSIHAGFDCILHPYDSAVCFVTYDVLVNGSPNFGQVYLSADGNIVINVPSGLTFTNLKAHYIEL